jgi:predicted RNA-binding Zn-ribbon protein involved in translation (DUF1610 family)
MKTNKHSQHESAYNGMLEHARSFLHDSREEIGHSLHDALESAKKQAVELGNLSKNEAELIGTYLRRDLHDAGEYIHQQRGELGDWLRFDIKQVEQRIWESLSLVVDKTTIELNHLRNRAHQFGEWHTGEITGPGTLVCSACDAEIHFHKTGHIPPCPKCHRTIYHRSRATETDA